MVAYKKYCIRMVLSCQGVQMQVVIVVKDKVTENCCNICIKSAV